MDLTTWNNVSHIRDGTTVGEVAQSHQDSDPAAVVEHKAWLQQRRRTAYRPCQQCELNDCGHAMKDAMKDAVKYPAVDRIYLK
jgi:hypothetical protein